MKKLTKAQEQKQLSEIPTTSGQIRYLDSRGYTRSEIAIRLGKRYQHIRNVLITPLTTKK